MEGTGAHALTLHIPKSHPRESGLFQDFLVQIVELVEFILRSGFGIAEHIGRVSFRQLLQKVFCFGVERQQPPAFEDVPVADMKIGPRQGDQFTLPQAA